MEIPSPKSNASLPIKLISSTRLEWQPRFSPDGKKIAFVSDRSGSLEVWVCNADSSNPVQLTFFAAAGVAFGENPWSPDGSRLVFSANPEGVDDVFVVNANGGGLRRLIPDRHGSSSSPFWSRDGRWIFFDMVDSGKLGIYKSPAADGAPVLLADDPGYAFLESSDGKFIYYYKTALDGAGTSLWRDPSSGGEKQQFLDLVENRSVQIADDGIYFKRPEKEKKNRKK